MIDIKRIIWGLIFLFSVCIYGYCLAQADADTLIKTRNLKKSPDTAVLRSALFPGLGQLYNQKIFKAIVVLGGEIALAGNAVYYNQLQVQSKTEEEWEFYRNIKSRFLWWLFAVHLLNIIDAYVDASLFAFDTGPDLSLENKPFGSCIVASFNLKF